MFFVHDMVLYHVTVHMMLNTVLFGLWRCAFVTDGDVAMEMESI